jgi:chloramphenicol 3-O-phosphotransferase
VRGQCKADELVTVRPPAVISQIARHAGPAARFLAVGIERIVDDHGRSWGRLRDASRLLGAVRAHR